MRQKYNKQYTENQCIEKHLYNIFCLTTERVEVEFSNRRIIFEPKSVELSTNFFRSIKCKRCGRCCRRYYLVYDEPMSLKFYDKKIKILVNKSEYCLYVHNPDLQKQHCTFCNEEEPYTCKYYNTRPILSRMPHMFFKENKDKIVITKRQFGRNWALKCQAEIKNFDKEELREDIETLLLIDDMAKSYGVVTVIPIIVKFLEEQCINNCEKLSNLLVMTQTEKGSKILQQES